MSQDSTERKKILVTGSRGFLGKNLTLRLKQEKFDVAEFNRGDDISILEGLIAKTNYIVHLAGENRPQDTVKYWDCNFGLTKKICNILSKSKKKIPILFSSTSQVKLDNLYAKSKVAAEYVIQSYCIDNAGTAMVLRFPGIFGKWAKPNYNSVVSTFCYNISRGLPIEISNESTILNLCYVDDIIDIIFNAICNVKNGYNHVDIEGKYQITLGELVKKLTFFKNSRDTLLMGSVGTGIDRALYATYLSYLSPEKFSYSLVAHEDERGKFVEVLKTIDSGQISYISIKSGSARGKHFHNTKTEKFIVLNGQALYKCKNVLSGEVFEEVITGSLENKVLETIPGWAHEIINIGNEDMLVLIWSNEVFDIRKPDTFSYDI
jgi:UDP-2-acetamido-2,6-beta-L-arabino-hexul-4-ose reductase